MSASATPATQEQQVCQQAPCHTKATSTTRATPKCHISSEVLFFFLGIWPICCVTLSSTHKSNEQKLIGDCTQQGTAGQNKLAQLVTKKQPNKKDPQKRRPAVPPARTASHRSTNEKQQLTGPGPNTEPKTSNWPFQAAKLATRARKALSN